MHAPRQNRTFICSVLFLDIVEYSSKPVAMQIRVKERLNRLLTDAPGICMTRAPAPVITPAKPPVELATVSVAVSRWGEVFINDAARRESAVA